MILQDLFIQSQRRSGTHRPIQVINPEYYNEFFERLKNEVSVPLYFKAFITFALSGGLRVSEALSVRVCEVNTKTGSYQVTVLKKRVGEGHQVKREVELHPIAMELFIKYLKATPELKYFSFAFDFSRDHAGRMIRKLFGAHACPHSICRHSHISWLHAQGMSPSTISRIVEIDINTTQAYNHVDRRAIMRRAYKKEMV